MYYIGIDIGSTTSKAIMIDENEKICGFYIIDTLPDQEKSGRAVLAGVLDNTDIDMSEVAFVAATGYGRKVCSVKDMDFPEIICHGIGTKMLVPEVGSIIDIGGQDSKVIELDERGRVKNFEMNDKCAAGTGRFFEVLSNRLLKIPMNELSELIEKSKNPVQISSMCTIFAETEIISYLSQGILEEDIAAGMSFSVAKRVLNMAKAGQVNLKSHIVFSGGAAQNRGLKKVFEEILGVELLTIEHPQSTAAYGAAIMAHRYYMKKRGCEDACI